MAVSPPLFTTATPLDDRCDHLDGKNAVNGPALGGGGGGGGAGGRKRFKARLLTGERGVSVEFGKFVALVSISGKKFVGFYICSTGEKPWQAQVSLLLKEWVGK